MMKMLRALVTVLLCCGCGFGCGSAPTTPTTPTPGSSTPAAQVADPHEPEFAKRMKTIRQALAGLSRVGKDLEAAERRFEELGVYGLAVLEVESERKDVVGGRALEMAARLRRVLLGDEGPGQRALMKRVDEEDETLAISARGQSAMLVGASLCGQNGIGFAATPAAAKTLRSRTMDFVVPQGQTLPYTLKRYAEQAGVSLVLRYGSALLCTKDERLTTTFGAHADVSGMPEEVRRKAAARCMAAPFKFSGDVGMLLRVFRERASWPYGLETDARLKKNEIELVVAAGAFDEQLAALAHAAGGVFHWRSGSLVLEPVDGGWRKNALRAASLAGDRRVNRRLLPQLKKTWRRLRKK